MTHIIRDLNAIPADFVGRAVYREANVHALIDRGDFQFARECVRFHAEKSFDQRARIDADRVGEIALRFAPCHVVRSHRADISRTQSQEHGIEQFAFEQLERGLWTIRLPERERGMRCLGHHYVV